MENREEVGGFIRRFKEQETTENTFRFGCCFWFAIILYLRFVKESPVIMYDPVANHFGTAVNGVVYDITGDVTHEYRWEPWDDLGDDALEARIVRDCILF